MVVATAYDQKPVLRGDCQYYLAAAKSLYQDADLRIANQLSGPIESHSGSVALDQHGNFVPKHSPVLSLCSAPFVLLLGNLGAFVFNLIQMVCLTYLVYELVARYCDAKIAMLSTILTGVFSMLPHYVWNYSPDVFSSLLLVAGYWCLMASPSTVHRGLLAGFFVGLACVSKFALILFLPGTILLLFSARRRSASLVTFFAGILVPITIFAVYNYWLFGDFRVTSYDRIAMFEGEWTTATQRSDFSNRLTEGMFGQIFDLRNGLFWTSPITVISLLGFVPLARRNWRLACALVLSFSLLFCFYSRYNFWAASHVGNRFLLPLVVFSAIPLGFLAQRVVEMITRDHEQGAVTP